jgi:hypothetical protein
MKTSTPVRASMSSIAVSKKLVGKVSQGRVRMGA